MELFTFDVVERWLAGELAESGEDAAEPDESGYVDEAAHRAKWNPDTWGMTPEDAATNRAAESFSFQTG